MTNDPDPQDSVVIRIDPTRVRTRLSRAGREALAARVPAGDEPETIDLLAALQASLDRHRAAHPRPTEEHEPCIICEEPFPPSLSPDRITCPDCRR